MSCSEKWIKSGLEDVKFLLIIYIESSSDSASQDSVPARLRLWDEICYRVYVRWELAQETVQSDIPLRETLNLMANRSELLWFRMARVDIEERESVLEMTLVLRPWLEVSSARLISPKLLYEYIVLDYKAIKMNLLRKNYWWLQFYM